MRLTDKDREDIELATLICRIASSVAVATTLHIRNALKTLCHSFLNDVEPAGGDGEATVTQAMQSTD